jgi:hypothetical protein
LAYLAGAKASAIRPMAARRPSTVRSAVFRGTAFGLAKAFSMGLKSRL